MKKGVGFILSVSLVALPTGALADTPRDLADLVGARGAGGETQMEARGYVHIKTEKGDDRAWSYWWHPQRKECVTVAVYDGRFDAVTSTLPADCGKSADKSSGGGDTTAAVVVGGGLLALGIAALAHKSHHHDDGKHLDEAADTQYERGFRDGLYAQTYHNYDRSDDYSNGYSAGAQQRDTETSYRDSHAYGGSGYRPSVNLNDLLTQRAASADVEIQRRGFRTVTAYQAGETAYTIRSNDQTGQCVQVAVTDGRVRYIAPLKQTSCR